MKCLYSLVIVLFLDTLFYGSGDVTINGVRYSNDDVNLPFFHSNIYQNWDSGKCIQVIKVSGRGVKDQFEQPCSGSMPTSLTSQTFAVIGDPNKDALALYTEGNARLNVVRNEGCTVRNYKTADGVTTYTQSPVDDATCTVLRVKIADELEKNRIYWENWQKNFNAKMAKVNNKQNKSPPQPPKPAYNQPKPAYNQPKPAYNQPKPMNTGSDGGLYSPTISVSASFIEPSEPCKQRITVVGNGVKDTFEEDCYENGAKSIKNNGLFVYGDPNKLQFCLFSERPNTLVVVRNKVCTLKTYQTTYGVTTGKKSPMSISRCSQIRKRMSNALKSRSNNDDQDPVSPQPQSYPMYPTPPQAPLLPQPLTSYAPPTPPTPVTNPVNDFGYVDSSTSPTITYRPAISRSNNAQFTLINNNGLFNGQRAQEVTIFGRGVNDCFKDYSKAKDLPNYSKVNNIFALRDSTGDFGLFTDTWGVLWVFQNNQCFKRIYTPENGQTKITSTLMHATECSSVKNKLTKQMGGQLNEDSFGGPTSPILPQPQFYPMNPIPPQAPLLPQPLTVYAPPTSPSPVTNPINNFGYVDSSKSPTITYRPANSQSNNARFTVINNNGLFNGQRAQEVTLLGRGVNDCFKDYSKAKDLPNYSKVNNIFALRDSTGDFGLFTDTWGVLWVFQKNQCFKRIYTPENGQTKITSTLMSVAECSSVKNSLTNQIGGQLNEDSFGGEQVNMNWNNNQEKNRYEWGNNMDEWENHMDDWERNFNRKMANWEKNFENRMAKFNNGWY